MKHRLLLGLVLWAGLTCVQFAQAGPHIYYDDGDNINWRVKIADAFFQAKLNNRPIMVHFCKKDHQPSEDQVNALLKDEKLGKLINRHLYAISVDADKPPKQLADAFMFKKIFDDFLGGRDNVPGIIVLPGPNTSYQTTFTGNGWTPKSMEAQLMDKLTKRHAMPKQLENVLNKDLTAMEKALEEKKTWPKATPLYNKIMAAAGYSNIRDYAIEAMEKAVSDGLDELKEAYKHAKDDEYDDAKKLITKVQTEYKTLPLGSETAKQHLAAVKLLEAADKAAKDESMKTGKAMAIKSLDKLLNDYSETPYATLAIARKKDLAPPKAGK